MSGANTTRTIIYAALGILIGYDLFCAIYGWRTISAEIRQVNSDTGWLIALGWAALWLHWFGKDLFDYIRS